MVYTRTLDLVMTLNMSKGRLPDGQMVQKVSYPGLGSSHLVEIVIDCKSIQAPIDDSIESVKT
jgi:hypothetical protein